jgi:polar amino acid transport system substrate-binding protein
MANDIASLWNAKILCVETTYGDSVLDLQSNRIDIAFALNPTPQRALSIRFTRPFLVAPFGCLARSDLTPAVWDDLNQADIRIAFDIGSLDETCAHRFTPRARLFGFKTLDHCLLALRSGQVDATILPATIGLSAIGRNPQLGPYHLLSDPKVELPSCLGIQRESDTRFREVLNAWIDLNRATGALRELIIAGLALSGVAPEQVPAQLTF